MFETIVYGGLAVTILDGLAAIVNAARSGVAPGRVFQYIASGVLGSSSFESGTGSILLGVVLHSAVAFGVAAVYYLLARTFDIFIRYALIAGILYGIAVYFAMSYVIIPLSAARPGPFSWSGLIVGVVIHMLFVGLPVALIAKRSTA